MIKNNLKEIRKSKNMSQEEVIQALHISRQSLSKWENQRGNPDLENLVALSKFYGVPINTLLNESLFTESTLSNNTDHNDNKSNYNSIQMLLYLTILVVSTFISFIGIGVSVALLIKLRKQKYPKIFYGLCIICLLISIFSFGVLLNSYFFHFGTVIIQ